VIGVEVVELGDGGHLGEVEQVGDVDDPVRVALEPDVSIHGREARGVRRRLRGRASRVVQKKAAATTGLHPSLVAPRAVRRAEALSSLASTRYSSRRPGRSRRGVSRPWRDIRSSSERSCRVGPSATMRPASRTMAREHVSAARARSCVAKSLRRLQALNDPDELPPGSRVEAARGLVQDEDVRFVGEQASQGDALFLAAAEPVRQPALVAGQADVRERLGDALAERVPPKAQLKRAEGHVLSNRRAKELVVGILKEQADLAPRSLAADSGRIG
jgi:hypothetical protein